MMCDQCLKYLKRFGYLNSPYNPTGFFPLPSEGIIDYSPKTWITDFNLKMLGVAIKLRDNYADNEDEYMKRVCCLINDRAEIKRFKEKVK